MHEIAGQAAVRAIGGVEGEPAGDVQVQPVQSEDSE